MADAPGVERRLAAILAADVVGYMPDVALTHRRLESLEGAGSTLPAHHLADVDWAFASSWRRTSL